MARRLSFTAAFALLALMTHSARAAVSFTWAAVGDAGNDAYSQNGFGAVAYDYQVATTEVTNAQYAEFLNAVAATDAFRLYNTNMGSQITGGITRSGSSGSYTYAVKTDMGDKPVAYVNYYNAARFVNWLHNGQPIGAQGDSTTENGVYDLTTSGVTTTDVSSRQVANSYVLPNADEFTKAGFYDGGSDAYFNYATMSNAAPAPATADAAGDISNPGASVVNWNRAADWNGTTQGNVTTVGTAGNASFYGAYDMNGNVFEWVEVEKALVPDDDVFRRLGGGFNSTNASINLSAAAFDDDRFALQAPATAQLINGFRVALIPEPATAVLLTAGSVVILCRQRREV